ncbi:MAG TPA: TonB-dependent receptor [Polyangiaceae bacterium]|nr:TonB-dependent receptor [Polyangiaceae bacterium]
MLSCLLFTQLARAQSNTPPAESPPESTPPNSAPGGDASEQTKPPANAVDRDKVESPTTEPETKSAEASAPNAESAIDPSASVESSAGVQPSGVIDSPAEASAAPPRETLARPSQDVTIVGTRTAQTAGSAHLINRRQLERFRYTDPQQVLQQAPGVYVRQEDGIGLRPNIAMRGVDADRSKKLVLMEDGVLFGPAPYSAPAAYYFPLITRMAGVRVIKGPSGVAFGPQTVGGAIDFLTRAIPEQPAGAITISAGQYGFGQLHAHAGATVGKLGFLVEGVRLWNTGFKHLPSGADTGSTRDDWMVKVSYTLESDRYRNEFLIKLAYAEEASNETYLGLTDRDFRADPYRRYPASALDRMENHRTGALATHRFEYPAAHLKLTTSLYRHEYARTWRKLNRLEGGLIRDMLLKPDDPRVQDSIAVLRGESDSLAASETLYVGPNQRTFVSQGAQTLLNVDLAQGNFSERVELGVRLHDDRIHRHHSESGYAMRNGELYPVSAPTLVNTVNTERSTAVALHALAALQYRRLIFTPGLRTELIRMSSEDHRNEGRVTGLVRALVPGAGVYAGLNDDLGLLGGVYRGFSPPPPNGINQNKVEYSVNYEAGARYSRGARRLELIGYFNDYSNLTSVCTFSSGCDDANLDRQTDAGRARTYGFEAFATEELRLSGDWQIPATVAYTWTRGEYLNDFTSEDPTYGQVRKHDEMPYRPRHQLKASVAAEKREVGFISAAATYVSAMRELPGRAPLSQSLVTDEQFLVDVSGGVQLWGPFSMFLNVRNLFDSTFLVSRRPFGARPNPPRWIEIGLRAEAR